MLETTAACEEHPWVQAAATLVLLNAWHTMSWSDVAASVGRAARLLWSSWSTPRVFESLPQHDQAAVHHALAVGWRVHSEPLSCLGPNFWQSRMDEFRTELAYGVALRGDVPGDTGLVAERARLANEAVHLQQRLRTLPPAWQCEVFEELTPDRRYSWRDSPASSLPSLKTVLKQAEAAAAGDALPYLCEDRWLMVGERGGDVVHRLSCLPDGWQTEAVRRMANGVTPLDAVSDAAQSINIVRALGVSAPCPASPSARQARRN
ncbi:hypothetical protein ACH419_30915 [Streptomyces bobili]|uniref:hypothetical protein n=1 Tax=Streptomyces bobili TaxID=67280 RepID=UPI0037B8AE07